MNDAQQVFTVFYGLYFATSLGLARPMQPFDTAGMYRGNYYAWLRFLISFALLNVLPLIYFVCIFNWLTAVSPFSADFPTLFMLLVLSLAGFGFYRFYVGVMLWKVGESHIFYGHQLPVPFRCHLDERLVPAASPAPHLVPGLIWVLLSVLLACLWTHAWG